jgi:hypothetical protein
MARRFHPFIARSKPGWRPVQTVSHTNEYFVAWCRHSSLLSFLVGIVLLVTPCVEEYQMERFSFTQHPASVGESYAEHFCAACKFAAKMISGGIACLVHAIFPFVFVKTGSSTVRKLYDQMVTDRISPTVED